jgi:phage baseplate assembly protein W
MFSADDRPDFVGAGWAFPVCPDARGGIQMVQGEEKVEQAIQIVLATPIGERRMRPEFGCGIHQYVFAPNNAGTHGRVRREVLEALRLWEPRIEVGDEGVEVEADPDNPSRLEIRIRYVIRATNEWRNLVYPFYLIPQEPESAIR